MTCRPLTASFLSRRPRPDFLLLFFTEIPLFHVLCAKITFDNIFAANTAVDSVTFTPGAGDTPDFCDIADSVFQVPADYEVENGWWHDELLTEIEPEVFVDANEELDDGISPMLEDPHKLMALSDSETEEFIRSLQTQSDQTHTFR